MAAIFWVRFDDGSLVSVSSADAKSMKRADLREASRKAVAKAKAKHLKLYKTRGAKPIAVNCVG